MTSEPEEIRVLYAQRMKLPVSPVKKRTSRYLWNEEAQRAAKKARIVPAQPVEAIQASPPPSQVTQTEEQQQVPMNVPLQSSDLPEWKRQLLLMLLQDKVDQTAVQSFINSSQ